jgi:hypothetical protein
MNLFGPRSPIRRQITTVISQLKLVIFLIVVVTEQIVALLQYDHSDSVCHNGRVAVPKHHSIVSLRDRRITGRS